MRQIAVTALALAIAAGCAHRAEQHADRGRKNFRDLRPPHPIA